MLIALSSSHLPPNVARVLRATGSQEFCDFISPCYILGTEPQSLLYVISNFRVGWIVLGNPPPFAHARKGDSSPRLQMLCSPHHVAGRPSVQSWRLFGARWAPFAVSPVGRQVECLSPKTPPTWQGELWRPGRSSSLCSLFPRRNDSLTLVAHAQSLLSRFPRPRPSLSSLPWEQVRP